MIKARMFSLFFIVVCFPFSVCVHVSVETDKSGQLSVTMCHRVRCAAKTTRSVLLQWD